MGVAGAFTTVDFIVLIVYLLAVLAAGVYFTDKDMTGKEFFRGDGTIPWYVTSMSIMATLLSPISFMTLAGNSYAGSWLMWFAQLGIFIAVPFAIKFFLPIYAKLDIDTAYDYLERRYSGRSLRYIGSIFFVVYQLGRMSIIMYLPSIALAQVTDISAVTLTILMGIIALIYSYTGGMKAVLWTDFIQSVILIGGVILLLVFLVSDIDGGFAPVFEALGDNKFLGNDQPLFSANLVQDSVFLLIIGAGFNTLSSYVSSQDIVQRFTTTNDLKKLNKMMLTNGFVGLALTAIFYLIGTGLFIYYTVQNPGLAEGVPQDEIFIYYIAHRIPQGITGIIIAALYAAAQSTLSTGINSVASSWTMDLQSLFMKGEMSEKQNKRIGQIVSLVVGIVATGVAILMTKADIVSAYRWFNGFMGLVLGILGGTFGLGIFTKRGNIYGAYAGLVASTSIMIWIQYFLPAGTVSIWANSLISISTSMIVGYIVSLLTKKVEAPKYTTVYDIPKIKEEMNDMNWMSE
ncbi:sodium:solute symporter [Dolosigranulum pigrum]|uniref:sodium:solute symporter n=1 Tax=Dolosigranulum pigrum TaxID=29394 RepID=UPI001AD85D09|nr:sodium:solute symporter [Dolosigranulum pigrum]QTJ57205.1 sodium/solute symporter [Dolosigranulum pigrum]